MEDLTISTLRSKNIKDLSTIEVFDEDSKLWVSGEDSKYLKIKRPSLGFSPTSNPYAPINAVTIFQSWSGRFKTFLVPPPKYDVSKFFGEIKIIGTELGVDFLDKTDFTLCKSETQLLIGLVQEIQNSDLLSGWNSEFFDLPYIMARLERVAPKLAIKMSFIGTKAPKAGTVSKFGEEQIVYKLHGRTHIDYLDLFKKFAQDVKYPSYNLGAIGEAEVGVSKIHFDGSFEEFYTNHFAKFSIYNIRDVDILVKLNEKRKLFSLINVMAHESTCLFENLMGTVRYVETALVNRAHYVHNQIVRDKNGPTSDGSVVDGALVLDTVPGLHEYLGSVDINSLYPSIVRALNISPEMMVGQFVSGSCSKELKSNGSRFAPENNGQLPSWKRNLISKNFDSKNPLKKPSFGGTTPGEYDWAGIVDGDDLEHALELTPEFQLKLCSDSPVLLATGAEWIQIFKEQSWAVTAYGTVFDQSIGLGIIPAALEAWYAERKAMQAEKKQWQVKLKKLEDETGFLIPDEVLEII